MKLSTRLIIIFCAIVILPFLLAAVTYFIICSSIVWNMKHTYGIDDVPLSAALNPSEIYSSMTEEYLVLLEDKLTDEENIYNVAAEFSEVDNQLSQISSFLIIREEGEILYINNERKEDSVLGVLDTLDAGTLPDGVSFYFNDLRRVVKAVNYTSTGGKSGTVYIVTCVGIIASEVTGVGVFISILVVMMITAIMLTAWLNQGIIKPLYALRSSMKRIEKGDLETPATTVEKGEVGEIFEGFEKMRIRLKESSEEQIRTEEANRELVSNISHDLKTPITSIKGYVEGIMDGVADSPEKMEKYIKTIYNKAGDMDFLIDELTMYSKIDANQIPYRFHRMNVLDYFSDCAEEVGLDLEAKGIGFDFRYELEKETEINADQEQLKRVINNIINNSVKYRKEGESKIVLRVAEQDYKDILVEISDNGKGVSEKDLEKIFKRFYRTDASRNSKQGGSGIGLSIARKIVEDHGGSIWATGKEGEGFAIHFILPIFVENPEPVQLAEEEPNNPIMKLEKIIEKKVGDTVAGIKTGVEKTKAEIGKMTKRQDSEENTEEVPKEN